MQQATCEYELFRVVLCLSAAGDTKIFRKGNDGIAYEPGRVYEAMEIKKEEGGAVTIHITLPGNIRSKKNSKRVFCRGKFPVVLPSKAYDVWEKQARQAALEQFYGPIITAPVCVQAVAYCKGVLPDLSGMLESVGDCLEGVILENDKQIVSWDGSRVIRDKAHQRTEIIITEV